MEVCLDIVFRFEDPNLHLYYVFISVSKHRHSCHFIGDDFSVLAFVFWSWQRVSARWFIM